MELATKRDSGCVPQEAVPPEGARAGCVLMVDAHTEDAGISVRFALDSKLDSDQVEELVQFFIQCAVGVHVGEEAAQFGFGSKS